MHDIKELLSKTTHEQKEKLLHKIIKHMDDDERHEMCEELYIMVHGEHLDENMARDWVSNMINKDGTHGEHYSWEVAKSLRDDYGISDISESEFYAVINMMWSDYYDVVRNDTDACVKLTKDWFYDKDGDKGKTYRYYKYILKN